MGKILQVGLSVWLLLGLLLMPLPQVVRAAPAAPPVMVTAGQTGGVARTMLLAGGQLFSNIGPRLVRMDLSTPVPGVPVYGSLLPAIPEDLKFANGFLYAALGAAGVAVIDPVTLQPLSLAPLPGTDPAGALAVGSKYLYAALGAAGIGGYDLGADKKTLTYMQTRTFIPAMYITDVETMTVVNGATTTESLFASANNYAALPADRGEIFKFDLSKTPVLSTPSKSLTQVDLNALRLTPAYVYAAGDAGLTIADTAELGGTGSLYALALSSPSLELALNPLENMAYLLDNAGGIIVADVSVPAAPVLKTAAPFYPQGSAIDLAVNEFSGDLTTYLFIADFSAGLSIATSPHDAPQTLTLSSPSFLLPKPATAGVVAGAYRQAFVVSNTTTLWTVNSTNPGALTVTGSGITLPTGIDAMTVYQNLLLISSGATGLLRYQLTPGAEPSYLDTYRTAGTPFEVAVAWPNAVIADGTNGLTLVNLNGAMDLVGHADKPQFNSEFRQVVVQGNYAYVNDAIGYFRVYNIADPTGPYPMGVLSQPGILAMKQHGNFVYLACGELGVRVVDISNPNAPAVVGAFDYTTPGVAQNLALYLDHLFVADGPGGVAELQILPGGSLSLLNTLSTAGNVVGAALVPGDYLYAADDNGGLVVVRSFLFGPNHYFVPAVVR